MNSKISGWKERQGKVISAEFTSDMKKQIYGKDMISDLLDKHNLICIASMEDDDGDIKYYFFGKQAGKNIVDLIEINITDRITLELVVKSANRTDDVVGTIRCILEKEGYM